MVVGSDLMRKMVSIFLTLMVIFSGLMLINIYQTKDQERIENIESTKKSFKIYISNTDKTSSEMVTFLRAYLMKKNNYYTNRFSRK